MRGWKDRILGSAMLLVLVAVVMYVLTSPPQEDAGFEPHDYELIASKYPGGTYVPQQNARYYRLCSDGYHWRLYPGGRIWWTQDPCWK